LANPTQQLWKCLNQIFHQKFSNTKHVTRRKNAEKNETNQICIKPCCSLNASTRSFFLYFYYFFIQTSNKVEFFIHEMKVGGDFDWEGFSWELLVLLKSLEILE
jgi:hypothetical protein